MPIIHFPNLYSPLNAYLSHGCSLRSSTCITTVWRRVSWVCCQSITHASDSPCPTGKAAQLGDHEINMSKLKLLKEELKLLHIKCDDSFLPSQYYYLLCPKCNGGQSMERSLSVHIVNDCSFAIWRCFRINCGWAGQTFADNWEFFKLHGRVVSSGLLAKGRPILEPLNAKLIAYFHERLISQKTLHRNGVMQIRGNKDVIAFTYRQNGEHIGCKYRTTGKKFWQEKGTEKLLYGLDDIHDEDEIIIVEGEIDKLSLEEAGFRNCVSVPGGAPGKISKKDLPPLEKDTAFQYVWNAKQYLDKVPRIILATDSDPPGRTLAEELARRLGKERCWIVNWPKKDNFSFFKDANEVLKNLGPYALRNIIENAESYPQETSRKRNE